MAEFTIEQRWFFCARAGISLVILAAGLYVLLCGKCNYSDATAKWAIASIGVVIGYWLR